MIINDFGLSDIKKYITETLESKEAAVITKKCVRRISGYIDRVEKDEFDYDGKDVRNIIKLFGNLTDTSGAKIELLLWQKFLLSGIYGFKTKTGEILFNDVFLFIAKKNGKTTLAAGLVLYNLLKIKNAQCILTATDYNQAKIAFDIMVSSIKGSKLFAEALQNNEIFIRESPPLTIAYYPNGSSVKLIPETRARQAQGFNATYAMFDEIASYRTSEIITKVASGQVRNDAIRIALTTAETNLDNPGRYEYERALKILDGKYIATNYFPLIYELDKDDNRWDETVYKKANPSLGVTKQPRKLIEERDRARQNRVEEASFFAYQLNLWSSSASGGMDDEEWAACVRLGETVNYDDDYLSRLPCCAAFDLSKVDDYSAYTLYFYDDKRKIFIAKHKFYIPQYMLESKIHSETEQLRLWVNDGYVIPTYDDSGGKTINKNYIADDFIDDTKRYRIIAVAYDAVLAKDFIETLNQAAPKIEYIPFSQSYDKMSPANNFWYESVKRGVIADANPVMRWMVSCVKIQMRGKNMFFEKIDYKQSPLRIDGVDTSVMALAILRSKIKNYKSVEEQARNIDSINY